MVTLAKISVIILNFKGVQDTIACVNSLLVLYGDSIRVFVCDNDSGDKSDELIKKEFSMFPSVSVLQSGRNGGFAFGNNVGIRTALHDPNIRFFWILNNDTLVRPGAIEAMVARMESDSSVGILGATLVYHEHPSVVQARGGSVMNPWTSISKHIGNGETLDENVDLADIERRMSFVSGASMFVSRKFIEEVGLLSERYFLYFEEADWVARSKGRFRLGYCPEAVIEHKEGASIGSSSAGRLASPFSVYHVCRSRLIFTRTHRLWALPTVVLRMMRYLLASLVRWDLGTANAIFCAMSGRRFR